MKFLSFLTDNKDTVHYPGQTIFHDGATRISTVLYIAFVEDATYILTVTAQWMHRKEKHRQGSREQLLS